MNFYNAEDVRLSSCPTGAQAGSQCCVATFTKGITLSFKLHLALTSCLNSETCILNGFGYKQIAAAFTVISIAEKQHEKRYRDLAENLESGKVFKRNGKVVWRCRNCGYLHEAEIAPNICPACLHPQAYFELLGENW